MRQAALQHSRLLHRHARQINRGRRRNRHQNPRRQRSQQPEDGRRLQRQYDCPCSRCITSAVRNGSTWWITASASKNATMHSVLSPIRQHQCCGAASAVSGRRHTSPDDPHNRCASRAKSPKCRNASSIICPRRPNRCRCSSFQVLIFLLTSSTPGFPTALKDESIQQGAAPTYYSHVCLQNNSFHWAILAQPATAGSPAGSSCPPAPAPPQSAPAPEDYCFPIDEPAPRKPHCRRNSFSRNSAAASFDR